MSLRLSGLQVGPLAVCWDEETQGYVVAHIPSRLVLLELIASERQGLELAYGLIQVDAPWRATDGAELERCQDLQQALNAVGEEAESPPALVTSTVVPPATPAPAKQASYVGPGTPTRYPISARAQPAKCKGCGASIFWSYDRERKVSVPVTAGSIEEVDGERSGTSHFLDCPERDQFSGQSRKQAAGSEQRTVARYGRGARGQR